MLTLLQEAGVSTHRHGDYFAAKTADEVWLPLVGQKGWAVLTTDKRIRYRPLEREALKMHRVALFCFTSTMSAERMRSALKIALVRMRHIYATESAPFVATISETGVVAVRANAEALGAAGVH